MDRVIEGKIKGNDQKGNKGFKLPSRKITVNVSSKSRGNHFLFELGRFQVIGSQL